MKKANLLFVILFLMANIVFAKTSVAKGAGRKPSQSEPTPITFKITYGERITLFSVSKIKTGGLVELSSNTGTRSKKEISAADYQFLKSKVSNLSGTSNSKEFCVRNYIELKAEGRELVGCLGAKNKIAQDMQETVNLLGVLF